MKPRIFSSSFLECYHLESASSRKSIFHRLYAQYPVISICIIINRPRFSRAELQTMRKMIGQCFIVSRGHPVQ